ncbi:MAG: hypothetical protein J4203_00680 [Candidatus Diapherotrites archaeon]|uniref:Uncharacterized protein n=1 Tax=Candidatus Iainarchaeum sp. TaxID=3101447 RepID=A0A8T4L664_9ARCH|nr:hypothetical protein [Candidatus Diapherotrites archaeon]
MEMSKMGQYLFLLGILVALVNGFMPNAIPQVGLILVVIGLVVGFLNVTAHETHNFLLATVALLAANTAGTQAIPMIGMYLAGILGGIATMAAPAALVVAVKALWGMAKD